MKKFFALILAVLMIAALAACSDEGNGSETNNNDKYKQETVVIVKETDKNGDTFYFTNVDSETVAITDFESTNAHPHEVTIPTYLNGKLVVGIAEEAFASISNVSSLKFPTEAEYLAKDKKFQMSTHTFAIAEYAFRNCDGLVTVNFPSYVTEIGESAFAECIKLTTVTFAEGSKLSYLGDAAFVDCKQLTSVAIPGSVETIGIGAFIDCDKLATVAIGEGVKHIGKLAFQGCDALQSLTLPTTLETKTELDEDGHVISALTVPAIGAHAFSGGQLTEVHYAGDNQAVLDFIDEMNWTIVQ